MPRRHNRAEQSYEPLDLTPADIVAQQKADRKRPHSERIRTARESRAERVRRQEDARINKGIDWSICLVPGCGEERTLHERATFAPNDRDHHTSLPLCYWHLAVAHQQVIRSAGDELLVIASARVLEWKAEEREQLTVASQQAWKEKRDGHIYYVRLNGLIKAGWTRDLYDRLRHYGPDVEILAHYPATRDDETHLHRQLRPFLAKGREWYEDCKALADFVAKAVEQHGPPTVKPEWSQPKQKAVKPRYWRGAA